jgi:hypothetical protein
MWLNRSNYVGLNWKWLADVETFLKGAFIRMYHLCGGRVASIRMLHLEHLSNVALREEVVFDEEKRLSEGATARGCGNGYSVAFIRRLRAGGYGRGLASV